MKHLRRLTREQKVFLSRQGLKPKEYKLERKDADSYTFYTCQQAN
ncbi:DUF6906 family protein [Caloramator australicus]|uniref:DUF6906 domain-containing protein n=1 Tax=Caloramator australicus RC3 TaxID=857293 RepID=I7LFY9_9CLOT|nr:hypothetical protein [Caloramator australicus]CCJ32860.1 hypothetical protein CAAU_0776 [Caloramator australicus RC3]